jgi:hypothetical protein
MRGSGAPGQGNRHTPAGHPSLHPGIVPLDPELTLSHRYLARAHTLQGDTPKARTSDQDFFALGKDADSDIPILKQAKSEYEKLKQNRRQPALAYPRRFTTPLESAATLVMSDIV